MPISNFSSVFEVAFAMNAILYLFSIRSDAKNTIATITEEMEKIREEYMNRGFALMQLVYPRIQLAREIHSIRDVALTFLSLSLSLVSIAFLILGGFSPSYSMPQWLIFAILAFLLLPIPMLSYLHHKSTKSWANEYRSDLYDALFEALAKENSNKQSQQDLPDGSPLL